MSASETTSSQELTEVYGSLPPRQKANTTSSGWDDTDEYYALEPEPPVATDDAVSEEELFSLEDLAAVREEPKAPAEKRSAAAMSAREAVPGEASALPREPIPTQPPATSSSTAHIWECVQLGAGGTAYPGPASEPNFAHFPTLDKYQERASESTKPETRAAEARSAGSFGESRSSTTDSYRSAGIQAAPSGSRFVEWVMALALACIAVTSVIWAFTLHKEVLLLRSNNALLVERSEAATRAAQESMRTEQRAWVGLVEAVPQPMNATGGSFLLKLQNTGKTPAKDVRISGMVKLEDLQHFTDNASTTSLPEYAAGVLMPGATYTATLPFQGTPLMMGNLFRDQTRATNYAYISYKDIFDRVHKTRVCFYWYGSLRAVKSCEDSNDMD